MSQLLAQGGFGCVYYPGLSCRGRSTGDQSVVTKIQLSDSVAHNEIVVGKRIEESANSSRFFLPVVSSCPLKVQKSNKLLQSCDVLSDVSSKYIAMDIPYIKSVDFGKTLKGLSKKRRILTLIDTYKYLLYALQELDQLDIVHYDLKFGNVLFRHLTTEPRVVDFGIAIYNVKQLQSKQFPLKRGDSVTLEGAGGVVEKTNRNGTCEVILTGRRQENRSTGQAKRDCSRISTQETILCIHS